MPRWTPPLASAGLITLAATIALWPYSAYGDARRPDPDHALRVVHLPALDVPGVNGACPTRVVVQNVGADPARAILVVWGDAGLCPPRCAGPLKVECTGIIRPGSAWTFSGAQVPSGSRSGALFMYSAPAVEEILGPDRCDPEEGCIDVLCSTVFFGVVGDCDDYRRYLQAYREGLDWAGMPMGALAGRGALAVQVVRDCPEDGPGSIRTASYGGVPGDRLGAYDPVSGGYAFYVPVVHAGRSGRQSVLHVQNAGLDCAAVEVWFRAQEPCEQTRLCEVATLAPGETHTVTANDCVGSDWLGSAWLRSSQPLAVVADTVGDDRLTAYTAEPAPSRLVIDPVDGRPLPDRSRRTLVGPLVYAGHNGWASTVYVQNMSDVQHAKVRLTLLDRSGGVAATLLDWICPRGGRTFRLSALASLPDDWVGSVEVASLPWWSSGVGPVRQPPLAGVVTLVDATGADAPRIGAAAVYNLQAVPPWPLQWDDVSGSPPGAGLVAIPRLTLDSEATDADTELVVQDAAPGTGFTAFAVFVFDQNGLVGNLCQTLYTRQTVHLAPRVPGLAAPGFRGTALVSAVYWAHEASGDLGPSHDLVNLAAVAVQGHYRPALDAAFVPATADAGIPISRSVARGMAPALPFGPEWCWRPPAR